MQINATYRSIWAIAYPIIIGSLAQNLIALTDVVFLGRVGQVELGASGLMSIYYIIMVMVGFAISRGGQIMIARRAGQRKYAAIGRITHNLFYYMMMVAIGLVLFLVFLSPFVLQNFINSSSIYEACLQYLSYRSYGLFFSFLGFVLMALYTGIGRTPIIAVVTIVLFLSNICLNYVLIFGKFGFPAMGIAGAGLASTLAEIISTIVGITYILLDKKLNTYDFYKIHSFDIHIFQKLSSLSTPLVAQYIVGLGGWFLLFSLIENMGEVALAISTVVKNIYTLYSIPSWGFGSAANSIVSNLIGQKKYRQALLSINRTSKLSFALTFACCLSIIFFPELIVQIFTDDPAVLIGSKSIFWVLYLIILAGSVSLVVFNAIVGTGATQFCLLIQIFSVMLYLGYAYISICFWELSLPFIWLSELLYWSVLALICWYYLRFGNWRNVAV